MDHHAVTPSPDPTPPLTFLHSPLAILALSIVGAVGGGYVRDRLNQETRDVASASRIEALGKRVDALENKSLPEAQFLEFRSATEKRLDDIRQDLRDLKKLLSRP